MWEIGKTVKPVLLNSIFLKIVYDSTQLAIFKICTGEIVMDALQASDKDRSTSLHELIASLTQVDFKLTRKEELICLLLCKGYTLTGISEKLSCSVHTVNKQIGHLKNKSKIKSLHALIAWYLLKNIKEVS